MYIFYWKFLDLHGLKIALKSIPLSSYNLADLICAVISGAALMVTFKGLITS